jgi:hypothetical protein
VMVSLWQVRRVSVRYEQTRLSAGIGRSDIGIGGVTVRVLEGSERSAFSGNTYEAPQSQERE